MAGKKTVIKYVVALSPKDAGEVTDLIGHATKAAALDHLAEVKAPPTDPYYANRYRVYRVETYEQRP